MVMNYIHPVRQGRNGSGVYGPGPQGSRHIPDRDNSDIYQHLKRILVNTYMDKKPC